MTSLQFQVFLGKHSSGSDYDSDSDSVASENQPLEVEMQTIKLATNSPSPVYILKSAMCSELSTSRYMPQNFVSVALALVRVVAL